MNIINLTQHQPTPEQASAGVVDLNPTDRQELVSLLTVAELPTSGDIARRCRRIAEMARAWTGEDGSFALRAMVGCAPWMVSALESALRKEGMEAVYSFSVRKSTERVQPDGAVLKVNVFRHVGWIEPSFL